MEKSKKILIFSTAYFPFVGGAEVAIKEITDRVSSFQFDMITARLRSDLPTFEKIGNVNVYRLGLGIPILDKLFLPFWGAIKTIQLNKKNNYNAHWCMMVTFASGAAYLANIFAKIFGSKEIPIILTLQEGDSEEYLKTKWFGLIDFSWKLALQRSAVVTVISNYLGERARRLGYKGEIKLIPNGVDVEKYDEVFSDEELNELRDKIYCGENAIILMSTSRLNVKNGLDLVVKAMKYLPENYLFYILGTGEEKRKLIELSESCGVSQRVHFEGQIDNDELPKYLKVADIFIRTSRSEGQGISFLEAMAARLPVIATPVGGIVDFLKDEETGYFCEPENPESIVKTVLRTVNDPNKTKITENAYQMVKEKYNWNLVSNQMMQVFEQI